jgi:peptide/nickel transport system substrate-binding protein
MSPDGLTWTFYLRKGVKFHDGVELTAKDVKFSIEQLLLPDCIVTNVTVFRVYIKSVEVKDPYTVVIHCKKPFLFLPEFLSDLEGFEGAVLPKDYYEKVGQDQFAKHPIGSGPYKFHSHMTGSYLKLEATGKKHWRDGVPRYKYMTFLIIPEESTRLAMLKSGEADIVRISRDRAKEVLDSGLNLITRRSAAVVIFYPHMQWTSPIFSDIRFRKALNLAIDKDAIREHLLGGRVRPIATLPGNSALTCGGDPTLKPYPYDPEEAKRLIKEGGWDGYEFDVPIFARARVPEFPRIVEAVVGYWQTIGLKPKMYHSEWGSFRKKWSSRNVQNNISGVDTSVAPGCSALLRMFIKKFYSKERQSHVLLPYIDERVERASSTLDIAEMEKLLGEIYRYVYDQYLVIPICEIDNLIATTKRIPTWDPGLRRLNMDYRRLIRQQ